jgi:hypothetical protein
MLKLTRWLELEQELEINLEDTLHEDLAANDK